MEQKLMLKDLVVEHQKSPLGIDCAEPRFGWKLVSSGNNVMQTAFRVAISADGVAEADTGKVVSAQSIEVTIPGWYTKPMTE